MPRARPAPWAVLVSGLLAGTAVLGFAASRGAIDPGLHGMASVAVTALAVWSHVRRGGGWDFLAVVLLLVAVGLGTVADGESPTAATLHLAAAGAAVLLSGGLHLFGGGTGRLPLEGEAQE